MPIAPLARLMLLAALVVCAHAESHKITIGPGASSAVIAVGDSVKFTAGVSGTAAITVSSGSVKSVLVKTGQHWSHRFDQPALYLGEIRGPAGEVLGSLALTVVRVTMPGTVACGLGYGRPVSVRVEPAGAPVTFAALDPASLEVSTASISGEDVVLNAKPTARGEPAIIATITTPKKIRTIARCAVEEFTLEVEARGGMIVDASRDVGSSVLVMRPYVADVWCTLSMFAHSSTFTGGLRSISTNTSGERTPPEGLPPIAPGDWQRVADGDTTLGVFTYEVEVPPWENAGCIRVEVGQINSPWVTIWQSTSVNPCYCKVKVDPVSVCDGPVGSQVPLIVQSQTDCFLYKQFSVSIVERGGTAPWFSILGLPRRFDRECENCLFCGLDLTLAVDAYQWLPQDDIPIFFEHVRADIGTYDVRVGSTIFPARITVKDCSCTYGPTVTVTAEGDGKSLHVQDCDDDCPIKLTAKLEGGEECCDGINCYKVTWSWTIDGQPLTSTDDGCTSTATVTPSMVDSAGKKKIEATAKYEDPCSAKPKQKSDTAEIEFITPEWKESPNPVTVELQFPDEVVNRMKKLFSRLPGSSDLQVEVNLPIAPTVRVGPCCADGSVNETGMLEATGEASISVTGRVKVWGPPEFDQPIPYGLGELHILARFGIYIQPGFELAGKIGSRTNECVGSEGACLFGEIRPKAKLELSALLEAIACNRWVGETQEECVGLTAKAAITGTLEGIVSWNSDDCRSCDGAVDWGLQGCLAIDLLLGFDVQQGEPTPLVFRVAEGCIP